MEIKLKKISVRDVVEGYRDNGEGGVIGYSGKLDIRPPYQREFVYQPKERNAVIDTVRKKFPLNVMYWADCGDDKFEIIDGQQRTISVAQYVDGVFSIAGLAFHNLQDDQQQAILDYELDVYLCSGTDSEKLEWFKTINIAGKELSAQELRNAVYHGSWTSDAKGYFSHSGCPAYQIGKNYLTGAYDRQEYLETAIKWINDDNIEEYMSEHQHDRSAVTLWNHFRSVIDWVKATFTEYRKEMKTVDWGPLYNQFKDNKLDPDKLERETIKLMLDDDVTKKSGIYTYLLTGKEKYLSIRQFSEAMKRSAYEHQKGYCSLCKKHFDISNMEGDHIKPWTEGGKTTGDNCQMLCKPCNRKKSYK